MRIKEIGVPDRGVMLQIFVSRRIIQSTQEPVNNVLSLDITPAADIFKKWVAYIRQVFFVAYVEEMPIRILIPERGTDFSIQFIPKGYEDDPTAWVIQIEFTDTAINIAVHDSESTKPNLDWYKDGDISVGDFGKQLPEFLTVMYRHCALYV